MAYGRPPTNSFPVGNQLAVGHGAPLGNANAMRGGRQSNKLLTIGGLPKGFARVTQLTSALRRELGAAVIDVHGYISLSHTMLIQSACRHEQAALMCQRWLRLHGDTMSHAERLSYVQTVAGESDKRDRAVERLKLDRPVATILDTLYGTAGKITDLPAEGTTDASSDPE